MKKNTKKIPLAKKLKDDYSRLVIVSKYRPLHNILFRADNSARRAHFVIRITLENAIGEKTVTEIFAGANIKKAVALRDRIFSQATFVWRDKQRSMPKGLREFKRK